MFISSGCPMKFLPRVHLYFLCLDKSLNQMQCVWIKLFLPLWLKFQQTTIGNIFYNFPRKWDLTFRANCSNLHEVSSYFLGKIIKKQTKKQTNNINSLSSAEFAHSLVCVTFDQVLHCLPLCHKGLDIY